MIMTSDILITINCEKVLLIKRAKEPFMDKLVMPGGHIEQSDFSYAHGCAREALEEVGFEVDPKELRKIAVLDSSDRDPRPGRRKSIVFHIDLPDERRIKNCVAASDALAIVIREISSLSEDDIGFDHYKAIKAL